MHKENIFTGTWKVYDHREKDRHGNWIPEERYPISIRWIFEPTFRIELPDGSICFEGELEQINNGIKSCPVFYSWYPRERELLIDYSDYIDEQDAYIACDRYRVEHIGETGYRLYDLEDVTAEPHDYHHCFRITSGV